MGHSTRLPKRILLIDHDDTRRETRVRVLERAGYDVVLRVNYIEAEEVGDEGEFDLVVLALHHLKLDAAAAYSERLRMRKPGLPVLLLTDYGVFVPRGTLSPHMETGNPVKMMEQISSMIAGSTHLREIDLGNITRAGDLPDLEG